jgi:uncharacterized membrane protein YoaK (UPF0700 family)
LWLFAAGCVAGARVAGVARGLLALTALALGIQSAAIQRFGVLGLSTTYLTGTLTTLAIVGAQQWRWGVPTSQPTN